MGGSPFGLNGFGQQGQASCTASQIQVSAPLNPQYPISGVLTLTFSNGMTAQIRVVGPTAGYIGVMGIRNATTQEKCNIPSSFNVVLDSNLKEVSSDFSNVSCPNLVTNSISYGFQGKTLNGNFGCKLVFNKNTKMLDVEGCDFSKSSVLQYYYINGNVDDLNGTSMIGTPQQNQANITTTISFTVNEPPKTSIDVGLINSGFWTSYCNVPSIVNDCSKGLNINYQFPAGTDPNNEDIVITGTGSTQKLDLKQYIKNDKGSINMPSDQVNYILNNLKSSDNNYIFQMEIGGNVIGTTCQVTINCGASPSTMCPAGQYYDTNTTSCKTLSPTQTGCNPPCPTGQTCTNNKCVTNTANMQPTQSQSDIGFYQQLNIGDLSNVLFTLNGDNQNDVLLTPSTNFVIYNQDPNNQIEVTIVPSNSNSPGTVAPPCNNNLWINCYYKINKNSILTIPADKIFQIGSQATQLTQSFNIYVEKQNTYYLLKSFNPPLTFTSTSSFTTNPSTNTGAALLYISPNYENKPTIISSQNQATSQVLYDCETPTPN
jgi:hypothetical protein